ncbi:MAG: agmatinase [Bryobacteraceae bacterium]|nr:agmatinase [Bryobacteraceae bacterium]
MKIGILGAAFDAHSSYLRGPAQGPSEIRRAFHSPSANYWSESGMDLGQDGLFADSGDVAEYEAIRPAVTRILECGDKPLVLGGDHSITYPVLQAVAAKHRNLTILHIDAHADLYDEFEGSRLSHACPFARILEEGLAARLVQMGIRTLSRHQREQAERFGVEVHEMRDGVPRIDVSGPTYLSLDLDALDPAFAPGVSHHEPGGFSTRQVIELIQQGGGEWIGADIVELNPARDVNGVTAMTAAKLFKEIAAKLLA